MMRPLVLLLALLTLPVALAAPPALTGPYAGLLRQGDVDHHDYDNNPGNNPCIDLATTYRVTLLYAPADDVLTLRVGGDAVAGLHGRASIVFWAGVCAAFTIEVEGTSVADTAAYVVQVQKPALADVTDAVALEWG